ncbi:uncharacterized protein PV09_05531 [Verruconis gallopava]|uniref:Phosphatidylinositol transfer protein SFH5 n=1 Tax=Verruconis gallopava TaxID=253628 RepID=A0A0D2A9N3_9PEZI|nr:uncharacterized protein PV09_05531 [Verruconis gallopava]KIW03320.1 hypothetical protein PV09_05531 [Verruconis gallopava]
MADVKETPVETTATTEASAAAPETPAAAPATEVVTATEAAHPPTEPTPSGEAPATKDEAQPPAEHKAQPPAENEAQPPTTNEAQAPATNEAQPSTTDETQPPTKDEAQAPAAVGDGWPTLDAEHPLHKFLQLLPEILKECEYTEVYGVTLKPEGNFHTKLILQKFLRANANDLGKAKDQLTKTLKWRKEFQPLKVKDEVFSQKKFGGLGYILKLTGVPESKNEVDVCTFNIYGAVKDNKETFGDLDAFIKWRVALMERSVHELGLANATKPIPDYGQGPDPYQGFQVHDYMNVSFLRQDPLVKAASKKAIEVFGAYYPETMSRKFFVSVPLIMSWMFTAMRVFISKETQKKFTVMSYATSLAGELGESVPQAYGGKGEPLDKIGQTVKTE